MKSLLGYSAPAGAEAVYFIFWYRAARVFRVAAAVIAVMAVLGGISALFSEEEGGWLFALITIPFIYFIVFARRMYDVEPVFASRDGISLLRNGAWRTVSWSRVGEVKPLFGIGFSLFTPVAILLMPIEGEPRPVRFVARRKHLEILENLRSGSGR